MPSKDSTQPRSPERDVCSTSAASDRVGLSARLPSDKESGVVAVAEYAAKVEVHLGRDSYSTLLRKTVWRRR